MLQIPRAHQMVTVEPRHTSFKLFELFVLSAGAWSLYHCGYVLELCMGACAPGQHCNSRL